MAREPNFGANDETFRLVTHLGHLLQVGDVVLGYDPTSTVLSGESEWSMDVTKQDENSNWVEGNC